jgi:hypothetical protein
MDFLKSLLAALPHAASSPYAFVAYVSVVVAWVVIALKVKRNAQLLAHIDKLPPKDRLAALQLEMGTIRIKENMTPEEWLRGRVHSYIFYAFCILCLASVVVFVVAYSARKPGGVDVDITPYSGPSPQDANVKTPTTNNRLVRTLVSFRKGGPNGVVDNVFDESSGGRIYPGDPEFTLTYEYDRNNGKIIVIPKMPYLSRLSEGGPVAGIAYEWSPFAWQFPKLSIKIVNNTDRTLEFSEAAIRVSESAINTDPVIVIQENEYNVGKLAIVNEGWGKVIDPSLDFGITKEGACNAFPQDERGIHLTRNTFNREDNVLISEYVPSFLQSDNAVCVFGEIQFTTESGVKRSLKFTTLVSLISPGPALPAPPDYLYDLFLKAGEAGYTTRIPISEKVNPGDVDHFLIRIGTDKSATFNLAFSFLSEPVVTLPSTQVLLSVFVPRSQVQASHSTSGESMITVSPNPGDLAERRFYLFIRTKGRPDYHGHIHFVDNQQFEATGFFSLPPQAGPEGEQQWDCDANFNGTWLQISDDKLTIKVMHVSPIRDKEYAKACSPVLERLSGWSSSCTFTDNENCDARDVKIRLHPN